MKTLRESILSKDYDGIEMPSLDFPCAKSMLRAFNNIKETRHLSPELIYISDRNGEVFYFKWVAAMIDFESRTSKGATIPGPYDAVVDINTASSITRLYIVNPSHKSKYLCYTVAHNISPNNYTTIDISLANSLPEHTYWSRVPIGPVKLLEYFINVL
jgi:hypothetical protein